LDAGVDIESETDGVKSARASNVFDSYASKDWAIKLATEAAISVLKVDSIIVSKQAGIAPPKQSGHWDDD
jgi:T-complex protein 1 subunit theta